MMDGPAIAALATAIGDPARANMLTALMDGRALTVSELAHAAGVALPTASGHLGRLEQAGLVAGIRQGRHRYVRLVDDEVAALLEQLMGLAQRGGSTRTRTGPRDPALREARICYDHLAGARAVALMRTLRRREWIAADAPSLTPQGRAGFAAAGFDLDRLSGGRRPLCRACLDWSEREEHLAGTLGAAILDSALVQGWAQRGEGRLVRFAPAGAAAFERCFGIDGAPATR
jgi:DNA-binding transcriptional ArsR family regulator